MNPAAAREARRDLDPVGWRRGWAIAAQLSAASVQRAGGRTGAVTRPRLYADEPTGLDG